MNGSIVPRFSFLRNIIASRAVQFGAGFVDIPIVPACLSRLHQRVVSGTPTCFYRNQQLPSFSGRRIFNFVGSALCLNRVAVMAHPIGDILRRRYCGRCDGE